MRKIFLLSFILLLLAVSPAACAEVITVSPGGLSDALNAAADGDVLILSDGVYAEPAETFPLRISSEITLRAAEGASPVIDAPPFLSALRVEAEHVSLQGLDIQFRRHGLYVTGSHIRITDCSFRLADEQWRTSSCGIWLGGVTNAVLQGCDFTGCGICLAGPPLSESSKSVPVLTGMFEVGESRDYFTTHTISSRVRPWSAMTMAGSLGSLAYSVA